MPLTLDDLTSKVDLSKSSVSRRIKVLKSTYLVESAIVDRKMLVSISETGRELLNSNSVNSINKLMDPIGSKIKYNSKK